MSNTPNPAPDGQTPEEMASAIREIVNVCERTASIVAGSVFTDDEESLRQVDRVMRKYFLGLIPVNRGWSERICAFLLEVVSFRDPGLLRDLQAVRDRRAVPSPYEELAWLLLESSVLPVYPDRARVKQQIVDRLRAMNPDRFQKILDATGETPEEVQGSSGPSPSIN